MAKTRKNIGLFLPSDIMFKTARSPCNTKLILTISDKMQQYAGIYLLQNNLTSFGCPSHPSSGKKSKSVPLQAWSAPEGSRKLRFQDIMTTAQGGGKVVGHTHRPHLPQGNPPGTHFC